MDIMQTVNKHFLSYLSLKETNPMIENENDLTRQLVHFYIPYHLRAKLDHSMLAGLPKGYLIPPKNPSKLQTLLAKLCFELEDNNGQFFDCLPGKLCITEENAQRTFLSIAKEIIEDGMNWGRIISLFTFCGVMSCHFMKEKKPHLVILITKLLIDFINENIMSWINENGGWDGLTVKMSDKSSLWKNALVIGGIWATTYLLISRH